MQTEKERSARKRPCASVGTDAGSDDVCHRLILAGLKELEEHGVRDFSLRRVALTAQVSCAAPYRHFRSKEELIGEVFSYIHNKWDLFALCILQDCTGDPVRTAVELCVGNLRFWAANAPFRAALLSGMGQGSFGGAGIEQTLRTEIDRITTDPSRAEYLTFSCLTTVYGTLLLLGGDRDPEEWIAMARSRLLAAFSG